MKRVLTFLALLLLPLSLMAMTPISDADMSKVTAQAGVSIDIDVTMNVQFAELGWGDSDGYTGGTAGWIGLDSLKIQTLHIWPRTDFTMESAALGAEVGGSYGGNGDGGWGELQYLTIDVVTLTDNVAPASNNGPFYFNGAAGLVNDQYTAVRIGIPTLTITMAEMTGNVVLGPSLGTHSIGGVVNGAFYAEHNINAPRFNQLMGQFYVGGLNMAMGQNGAVLISAHGNSSLTGAISGNVLYGSGVTIDLDNVNIDYLLLDTAAWGDIDGVEDISSANTDYTTYGSQSAAADTEGLNGKGWVGLKNMAIRDIVIDGTVLIDVGTVLSTDVDTVYNVHTDAATAFRSLVECWNDIYNASPLADNSTFVSIMLANGFHITMAEMGATVALGQDDAFGKPNLAQEMGDIYVKGMDVTLYDNPNTLTRSYVHIFAH